MSERLTNTKIKKIKKKRTSLTIEQRVEILMKVLKKKESKTLISAHYNISRKTIEKLIQHKDQLFEKVKQGKNIKRKLDHSSKFIELNNKLYEWYQSNKSTKTITESLLREETCRIASLTQTKLCDIYKFVKSFMKRYGISESGNTNENLQYFLQQDDEANQSNENCIRELQRIPTRRRKDCTKLDEELYEWCQKQKASGNRINQQLLREAAIDIAKKVGKPRNMNMFLYQFKKRHNIVLDTINNSEILQNSEANQCNAEIFFQEVKMRLKKGDIKNYNIYIMFQADIIWNAFVGTLLHTDENQIAMQQIDIKDLRKKCLTSIFCTNITSCHRLFPVHIDIHETNEYENQNPSIYCESKLFVAHKLQKNVSTKRSKDFEDWYNTFEFLATKFQDIKKKIKQMKNLEEQKDQKEKKKKKKNEKKEEQEEGNKLDKMFVLVDDRTQCIFSEDIFKDTNIKVMFLSTNLYSKLVPIIEEMSQIICTYLKSVPNICFATDYEFNTEHTNRCIDILNHAWINVVKPKEIKELWENFLREYQTRKDIPSLTSTTSEKLIKSTGKDIAVDEISIMDTSCAESEKEHQEQGENIDDIKKNK